SVDRARYRHSDHCRGDLRGAGSNMQSSLSRSGSRSEDYVARLNLFKGCAPSLNVRLHASLAVRATSHDAYDVAHRLKLRHPSAYRVGDSYARHHVVSRSHRT